MKRTCRKSRRNRRSGKIMVMTGIMLPMLFAGALISADMVILANAEAHLKTMADAAALAGASVLNDDSRLTGSTNLSTLLATSRARAISIAGQNRVLGDIPVVANNPGNNSNGDIVTGYLSPTDYASTGLNTSASQSTFNAIQVNGYRNASHGGAINTFFGPVVNIASTELKVSSIAIAQNYTISAMQSYNGQNVELLPIVLDKTTYTAMMNRTTTDQYTYNSATGNVSAGADSVPESQLYPVASGNPGNWGTIKVGVSNNSTATLSSQIQYGITPAQLSTFSGGTIQLNTALNPPSITFGGNPGLSAGISSALTSQIGKVKVIGIYDQSGGNGNNTTYRVIGFAAVRIMAVNFQGNPKYVIVQPALTKSKSFTPGVPQASWTNGGVVRIFLAR